MDKVYSAYKKMNYTKSRWYAMLLHYFLRIVFGCDIMPKTKIGAGTRFPHRGLGVVINENAEIGMNCVIEANVCIGGNGKKINERVAPLIGNNVLIGSNAVIVGPVVIGDNAKIGAGTVVYTDVPEGATAVSAGVRILIK